MKKQEDFKTFFDRRNKCNGNAKISCPLLRSVFTFQYFTKRLHNILF